MEKELSIQDIRSNIRTLILDLKRSAKEIEKDHNIPAVKKLDLLFKGENNEKV